MKINEPYYRIAVALYMLPFLSRVVFSLVRGRPGDLRDMLILSFVTLTPAVLYFLGVRWCRYIVGAFSSVSALICIFLPMAQHSIDRTTRFWFLWCIVLLIFIVSSV